MTDTWMPNAVIRNDGNLNQSDESRGVSSMFIPRGDTKNLTTNYARVSPPPFGYLFFFLFLSVSFSFFVSSSLLTSIITIHLVRTN